LSEAKQFATKKGDSLASNMAAATAEIHTHAATWFNSFCQIRAAQRLLAA